MNRVRLLWDTLRSSLWFVPALMVAGGVLLALGAIEVDTAIDRKSLAKSFPRVFGAGAEGSRGILAAVAGSMITVAGVIFSITVVALTLASSQYTSRILRNFMRDPTNQSVLGVFVGVFAYCLVVLRTIRSEDEHGDAFVPALSVLAALALAFLAIAFLIYFIHHIATSIQATSIIQAAASETLQAVDRLYPEEIGAGAPVETAPDVAETAWKPVPAASSGYVQSVDEQDLFELARRCDTVFRMEVAVGGFIVEGSPLVSMAKEAVEDSVVAEVNDAILVGRDRTVHQDAGFGIRQIVDVALKALSPGVNDTTTAINAIDYLGAILCRMATRRIPSPIRSPEDTDVPRLFARGPDFDRLLGQAVDQIRQNADANVAVLLRLIEMLGGVATRTGDPRRRRAVRRQVELILETCERSVPSSHDRAAVEEAARARFALLG